MNDQSLFATRMQQGGELRQAGNFTHAIDEYRVAIAAARSNNERAAAYCQLGVTERLMGQFEGAFASFATAIETVPPADIALHGRIERDYGMLHLDTGNIAEAKRLFVSSETWLKEIGATTEAAISTGFLGRAYLIEGRSRRHAAGILRNAHKIIASNDDSGERDNLVWLARASFVSRWRYTPRALRLMRGTRRFKKYLVILIGGDRLHNVVRSRMR